MTTLCNYSATMLTLWRHASITMVTEERSNSKRKRP
nr:MAG TPA: hypothetical protein [Caudoviricetes sp.]